MFAGNVKKCATFLRTFFDRCQSEIDATSSQAFFLRKRRGVGPLCCPMPSWICVNMPIPCPGMVDKEGADTVGIHSSQTITFQMMIATSHFYGIEERSHIFIPLEFKHRKDTRPLWRMAFFLYLDGVWEWVQVTSDHMANHYTALAHAYATAKASSRAHPQVSSIAPPTECSLAVTLPSAQLLHKGGAKTCPKGSIRNVKIHPGSSDPPSRWTTWEEHLQLKPGEFTPDQIVAVMTQSQLKIDRTVARILEMFDCYSTLRLVAVIGHFKCRVGADNSGERWRRALLDFSYHNICFDLKQLIEVLRCDLQMTIHQRLVEVQADILEVIANFVDNFHIEVTTLSAPQVRALLDHSCLISRARLKACPLST